LLADDPSAPREPQIYASWPLDAADDSVHPKHRGQLATTLRARVDTIDRFVKRESIERLNLMKIDVDGHEYSVLKGAVKTLAKFQPILVMEMSPYIHNEKGHEFGALVGILQDAGYSIQDASTWKPLPLRTDELEALIPDGASINVIARAK